MQTLVQVSSIVTAESDSPSSWRCLKTQCAIASDVGGFLYCSRDNDERCKGANTNTASAEIAIVRHPTFSARQCRNNGCLSRAGEPSRSYVPWGRSPETAPNSGKKAYTRIE